jgi:hypothetical protein
MLSDTYVGIYLVLWQKGLVEREINELLRGILRDDDNERNKSNHNRKAKVRYLHLQCMTWFKCVTLHYRMMMKMMVIVKLNNDQLVKMTYVQSVKKNFSLKNCLLLIAGSINNRIRT